MKKIVIAKLKTMLKELRVEYTYLSTDEHYVKISCIGHQRYNLNKIEKTLKLNILEV